MTIEKTENTEAPPATRREWQGLVVLSIACFLYSMDMSVLFLAIPTIVKELQPSPTALLWINDIYGFMVAGFLVTMGTLGDTYGRRRLLLLGAAAFGAASVLCAFAQSAEMLVISRALLGVAGATIGPSTLSLIFNMFKREDEKARAIGVWGTAFAVGGLVAPVIGGFLLQWFHWGSVFLINVPFMLALIVLGPRLLPEYRNDKAESIDVLSVLYSLATVLPIIYAMKIMAAYGWSSEVLVALIAGPVFGYLFYSRQKSLAHPLVDFALFKDPRFNVALLSNLGGIFFIFAIFLFQNLFLQQVLNLTPLEAGLWSVPSSAFFCIMSFKAHLATKRFGAERTVKWGLAIFAVAAAAMGFAAQLHSLYGILAAAMLMAIGFVPVVLTTTNLIVSSAPPERAGSASAISETSAEFGGALGVALLGSLATFIYRAQMESVDAPAKAKATLGDAVELAGGSAPWLEAAQNAFALGYTVTCALAAAGLLVLSWLTGRYLREGEGG